MKPQTVIPVTVKCGHYEITIAYIYYLGVGQWFVATVPNNWTEPRYAIRICNF